MGIVLPYRQWIDLTFTLDTSAYASGDLLADVQALALGAHMGGQVMKLNHLIIRDEDDNTAAPMDVVFFRSSTSLGTENNAYAPSDTLMRDFVGMVTIDAADWLDVGGSKVFDLAPANLLLQNDGLGNIYVGLVTYGTPTQTASGIKGSFGFE